MEFEVDRDAEIPVGTQLAWRVRSLIRAGRLNPGDRLPSVREMADQAGVNVNTVRAVYRRLESEGVVRSEQGRGTFVAAPAGDGATREELRRQIAALEAELVSRTPLPAERTPAGSPTGGRLPTTEELRHIRDRLETRLSELTAERTDVLRRLSELEAPEPETRSSTSLRGARVRWLGA